MRRLVLLLRLVAAIALLAWVLNRLRWEEIARFDWGQMEWSWLIAALGLGGASLLGWAGRWWWFVRVYELRVPFPKLLRLTFFADFFNLYFLGPLGADGVRLLELSRDYPEKRGAIVGSLILDHVGGFFGGVGLYLAFSGTAGLPEGVTFWLDGLLPWAALLTFLGLGVIMEPPVQRIFARMPGLNRLAHLARPVFAGTFRHPWLFSGFTLSALSTASAFAAYWAAGRALGAQISLPQMLGIMPVVDLAASVPVTISGLGVRENLLVELLGRRAGCDPVQALAISLLGFAAIGLWGLLGGLAMIRRSRPEG